MPSSPPKLNRLLRMITLLQSGRFRSAQELMTELRISRRTLFRDLKILQDSGIPCFFDADRGYQIARSFFLPAIHLTVPETLGLLLLAKTASSTPQRPFAGPALSAVSKLIVTVPDPIRRACSDLLASVSIDPGAQCTSEIELQHYPTLQRAIDQHRRCRIIYKSPSDPQTIQTFLDPYGLHFGARAWYVLGFSSIHKETRVFKLTRILELQPTDIGFQKPPRWKVSDKLGKAWQLNPEGKTYSIELEFSPKVATNVTEVRWHPSQKQLILPDGRAILSFQIDGLSEIAWWICGYANHVRVLKPTALQQLVQKMHQSAFQQYAAKPTS